jgi:membrane protease YdiL (CAAX protease family)
MIMDRERFEELLRAAFLLCSTWTLLIALPPLLSFPSATALLLALRSYQQDRPLARAGGLLLLGAVAGYVSFPAWVTVIAVVGTRLNLDPMDATTSSAGGPVLWATTLLLAPVFEEVLYRERLLSALRPVIGASAAIAVTSVLFALPHVEPWSVLGTLMVGLALGTAMWAFRSLALCTGLHMGLNLAVLFVVLAIAAPGAAAVMSWEGTLGFEFPGRAPTSSSGTGVATLNGSGGGSHLRTLRLDGGIGAHVTLPITDPDTATLVSISVSAALGSGTLFPFAPPASPTRPQLTQGELPVAGAIRFCLFVPGCANHFSIPLTVSTGTVGVGVGGTIGAAQVTLQGAPWTVRSATVPVVTSGGETVPVFASGWLHGAFSWSSSTALSGGSVSLVTPVRVISGTASATRIFARLTIRFLPEPGWLLFLGSGLFGLAVLGHARIGIGSRGRTQ